MGESIGRGISVILLGGFIVVLVWTLRSLVWGEKKEDTPVAPAEDNDTLIADGTNDEGSIEAGDGSDTSAATAGAAMLADAEVRDFNI